MRINMRIRVQSQVGAVSSKLLLRTDAEGVADHRVSSVFANVSSVLRYNPATCGRALTL